MRNYLKEFHSNIQFIELLMKPIRQGIWNTDNPSSVTGWIVHISYDGNLYHSRSLFLAIYLGQILHGLCVFLRISAYDAIFMQCIMVMTYKFRTMTMTEL